MLEDSKKPKALPHDYITLTGTYQHLKLMRNHISLIFSV